MGEGRRFAEHHSKPCSYLSWAQKMVNSRYERKLEKSRNFYYLSIQKVYQQRSYVRVNEKSGNIRNAVARVLPPPAVEQPNNRSSVHWPVAFRYADCEFAGSIYLSCRCFRNNPCAVAVGVGVDDPSTEHRPSSRATPAQCANIISNLRASTRSSR